MKRSHRWVAVSTAAGWFGLIGAAGLLTTRRATAQEASSTPALKVGLALSGGSAKGFAHIGVLRVLEEAGVGVDVIVGTSMGAVVGGLYAIGYSPAMLEDVATGQDWEGLFTDRLDRSDLPIEMKLLDDPDLVSLPVRSGRVELPLGLVAGQQLSQLFARLTWPAHGVRDFRQLPIEFVAIASDLETGDAVELDSGVVAEAMRASISLPSIFAPVRVNGRSLIDGAFSRNLPAEDVVEAGANLVICSDVSEPLEPADSLSSLLDVLDQTLSFRITKSTEEQRRLCDVIIEPEISGLSSLSFDRAAEWIHRGEEAARKRLPEILARLGDTRGARATRATLAPADSVRVVAVKIEGLRRGPFGRAGRLLDVQVPAWLTSRDLDRAVTRAYATGLFAWVGYRLDTAEGDSLTTMSLLVVEGAQDHVGFNFRYESRYKASVMMSATLNHLLGYGSLTSFRLRLGEQLRLSARHHRRTGPGRLVSLAGALEFSRSPIDLFENGRRVSEAQVDVIGLSAFSGLTVGSAAVLGVQLKGEYAHSESAVAPEAFDEDDLFYTLGARLQADTYDRPLFPSRGVQLLVKSEWADRSIGSNRTFQHHTLDARGYLPLPHAVSLLGRVTVGMARGPDLPGHYLFFLGGASPHLMFPDRQFLFYGLDTQERRGRAVEIVGAGLQVKFRPRLFAIVQVNAGNVFDELTFDPDRYTTGYGITVGARTVLGQVTMTLAESDFSEWPDVSIDLGYPF